MDPKTTTDYLIEIKETLAAHGARLENIEKAVGGNGQPGLAQKIEDLQAAKNWTWGGGAVILFLTGLAEWYFHSK